MKNTKITPHEVLKLAPTDGTLRVSIYSNTLKELNEQLDELESAGTPGPVSLARGVREIRKLAPKLSWPGRQSSLGVFYHPKGCGFTELPFRSAPLLVVSDSFHIKPILKWIQRDRPYMLLYLAVEDGLIYEGTAHRLRRHPLGSCAESKNRGNSWRTLASQVNRLALASSRPWVIMGLPVIARQFRTLLDHVDCVVAPPLADQEHATLADLHQASLVALDHHWRQVEQRQIESYWKAKSKRRTSAKLYEIVELAHQGRIAHLFVNESLMVWCDRSTRGEIHYVSGRPSQGDDLLDDLAESVLAAGGAVTLLSRERMPESQAAAAILSAKTITPQPPVQKSPHSNPERKILNVENEHGL